MSVDLFRALEDVCSTGADRLLTSGGEQKCLQGADTVARLAKAARGRVTIMAGGGIGLHDAASIIERTGVSEIHVGLSSAVASPMLHRNLRLSMGKVPGREYDRAQVLEESVRKLQTAISLAKT
jgi:copper homeostasis protein